MGKLHEILAVEGDLEGQFKRILAEALSVFKKGEHFQGFTRTLSMFDEERKHEEEASFEHKDLTTTVRDKLNYVSDTITNYLDVVAQKERTNQEATGSVVIDNKVLLSDIPATMLLGLESKLRTIREVYEAIPTLPPGIKWVKDEVSGEDVWTTQEPETAMKTEKILKPFVLYEATDKHPAQVKELQDTENVGIYRRTLRSGMLSPREKHELLARIDKLIRSVKVARQQANTQEVVKIEVGKAIMNYING